MNSIDRLITNVNEVWPVERWKEFNVVVGVSGGADSVALLRALDQIQKSKSNQSGESTRNSSRIVVAHFNHKTRGEESERDQKFVEHLAHELRLPFVTGSRKSSDKLAKSEECLRDLRYDFLIEAAHQSHARYIALGHHAQDQIETILFRIVRGTGLAGLAGIPQQRSVDQTVTLVRPMLRIDKAVILDALGEWGQDYREDKSNLDETYSRNFLRKNVVPLLNGKFESTFETSVLRLGRQAAEQHDFLVRVASIEVDDEKKVEFDSNTVSIQCDQMLDQHVVVIREMLSQIWSRTTWSKSQMMFDHYDQVAQLILDRSATEPGFHLPGKILCRKLSATLTLTKES